MQSHDRHDRPPGDSAAGAEKDTPSEGQIVDNDGAGLLYLVSRSSDPRTSAAPHRVIADAERPPTGNAPTQESPIKPPVHQIDEYRIVEPLGRGGMGQVFLGRDTLLDRPVAVKFLAAHTPTERLRKRFLIEARAIARVQHPNVVAVYRVGISNGLPYLVTEHVAGSSLDRLPKPMPWEKALHIGIDLLRGLSAVHKQGVLHRDLKPANAMLTPEGTAKLLDFGLAKLAVELRELPAEFSRSIEREAGSTETAAVAISNSKLALQARADALSSTFMSGEESIAGSEPADDDAAPEKFGLAKTDDAPEATGARDDEDEDEDEDERESDDAAERELKNAPSGRAATREPKSKSLTETGRLLGTPAYMPPEMWLGAPATEQSDLYMFGELLYELCCGRPPHAFRQKGELKRAAINVDASALLQAAPTVNPRFAAVIDHCIRRSPTDRPRSAADVLVQLEAIAADPTDEATRRRRRRNEQLRRIVPLSLAVLAIGFSSTQIWRSTHEKPEPVRTQQTPRPRVAVLGLRVEDANSEALAGFARAFSELLQTELSAGEKLLLLPSASVDRAKLELGLDHPGAPPADGLAKLKRSLALDLVASGALHADKNNPKLLHVDVTIEDMHSGQPTARAHVQGTAQELFSLVSSAGQTLRSELGLVPLSSNIRTEIEASRPASREVAEHYAEAKTRFGHFEYANALQGFTRVVEAEPDFPLGHLGLADVLLTLGYEDRARASVRRAFELSGRLPRAERTLIEARYRETISDWPKAFSLYNALRTSFPDNAEYGLYLIRAQQRAALPAEALETVTELRRLNLRGAFAARLDLAEAKAQMELSHFTTALLAIERAAQQAESIGSPLLLADILIAESFARTNLNDHARALRSAERARELFAATGNPFGEVESLVAQSNAASSVGDYAHASTIDERTLQLALELGHTQLIAMHLGNMADLLCAHGRLDLATARAQAGLLLADQIGHREASLQSLVTLAQVALLRGELALSEQHLLRAQRALPTPDDPRMSAWVAWHRAELRIAQGRFEEAAELHQTSLLQREQNQLAGFAAESQAALAALALLRGQPAEASRLAQAAYDRFVTAQNADSAAWAQALLSQALAEQGQATMAMAAFTPALARLSVSQNLVLRVRGISALGAAAVRLSLKKVLLTQLQLQLHQLIAQAQHSEFRPAVSELEVRLYKIEHTANSQLLQIPPFLDLKTDPTERHDACDILARSRDRGWLKIAALATLVCHSPAE